MRNKVYITFTLIVLIALVIVLSKQNTIEVKESTQNQFTSIKQATKVMLNKKVKNLNKVEKKPEEIVSLQVNEDILEELNQQRFSTEPFVELMTVTYMVSECKQRGKPGLSDSNQHEKLEKLWLEYSKKCLNIISDYPVLSSKNRSKELKTIMMKMAFKSQYADMIQRGMAMKFMGEEGKEDFLQEVVGLVLRSQNGPLISSLKDIVRGSEGTFLFNKVSELLGTINNSYTKFVYQQAVILYSCNFTESVTCLPSSQYMITQCYSDEIACGLDVPTWFGLNHTEAHNRDIARVMDFLENVQ